MTMRRPVEQRLERRQHADKQRTVRCQRSDQAFAHRERDGLRAAARVELGHDVVQHVLHGAFRVARAPGRPRASGGRRRSAPAPAARDRSARRRRARGALPFSGRLASRCSSRSGVDDAGAVGRRADRRGERLGRQLVLAQVADRARLQSADSAASWPPSDAHTITRAPVASRTRRRSRCRRAATGRASTRSASNSAGCSHASRTRSASRDGLDLFEQVEASHESSAVDRVGVEDEELHPWSGCRVRSRGDTTRPQRKERATAPDRRLTQPTNGSTSGR